MTPLFEMALPPLLLVGAEAAIAPRLQKTDGASSANGATKSARDKSCLDSLASQKAH